MKITIYLPVNEANWGQANDLSDKIEDFLEKEGITYIGVEATQ
jgi:hypothetical protein